jgi:hypothetical protein
MPEIVTTWTVTLRRSLEDGEDPCAPGTTDIEHLLWAVESGEVDVSVRLVE